MNNMWIWGVTLTAAAVAGAAIWRTRKVERHYRELLKKQQEMEKIQSEFVRRVGEDIYEIVENTYKKVAQSDMPISRELIQKEKELLNVTSDLLEFLRLRSKKVDILHEKLNLNNVLNEVAGRLGNTIEHKPVEVIFDIDNDIPRYLLGDASNLEKALYNILEYMILRLSEGEVSLDISMYKSFEENIELQFKFTDDGETLSQEVIETLFLPNYNEETRSYEGLGLYVSKALIELMGGNVTVHTQPSKGLTFLVSLPFDMLDPKERRKYRLPSKTLMEKKVFICDINMNAALATKKLFAYFRHEVTVMSKEEFLRKRVALKNYDMILLHPYFLRYKKIENVLRHLKKETPQMKLLALDALLARQSDDIPKDLVDKVFVKPLTQERVFELIINLFSSEEHPLSVQETNVDTNLTHRNSIPSTKGVTRTSFADFSGMRLLIVEDDVINQKVLINILKDSGIEIVIADNGMKAVETVKVSKKLFDLVLMDINMPIMDGYTATRMIRMDEAYDTLPIVAFTALALEDERDKIFESGMNAFLTKPLDIGKLYTVFSMYYKKKASSKPKHTLSEKPYIVRNDIIDMPKGLRYANDNEGLYAEVLKEFLDAYGKSDEVFETLVREHRFEQLKLLLLDMKGLTATIGAAEMYRLVEKLHQLLLYRQEKELKAYVDEYRQKLYRLIKEINVYLHKEE